MKKTVYNGNDGSCQLLSKKQLPFRMLIVSIYNNLQ